MFRRQALHRCVSLLVLVSLLSSTLAPVAHAQDAGPGQVFLPVVAGAAQPANPSTSLLFRTHVTVKTTAQWRDLTRLGVTVLQQSDNWALVLADDLQLEALARLRFNPDQTNSLESLAAAHAEVAASLAPLLNQAAVLAERVQSAAAPDEAGLAAQRADLRAAVTALAPQELALLAQVAGVDTDGDGLTDDQEFFWCTDKTKVDSDFSAPNDRVEVDNLKAWLNNERAGFPSSGKPFLGWPPQKTDCYDDDKDSVPDLAEINE